MTKEKLMSTCGPEPQEVHEFSLRKEFQCFFFLWAKGLCPQLAPHGLSFKSKSLETQTSTKNAGEFLGGSLCQHVCVSMHVFICTEISLLADCYIV